MSSKSRNQQILDFQSMKQVVDNLMDDCTHSFNDLKGQKYSRSVNRMHTNFKTNVYFCEINLNVGCLCQSILYLGESARDLCLTLKSLRFMTAYEIPPFYSEDTTKILEEYDECTCN